MEHNFTGPSYTIGIEEELMICDGESFSLVNAIESLLKEGDERVKPELMQSVLEIATAPARDTVQAGAELRAPRRRPAPAGGGAPRPALRREVRHRAPRRGMTIGSAGTHPFAMWEDQRIVA